MSTESRKRIVKNILAGNDINYLEQLRREQAEKVMPLIGSLLDTWELLSNDVKSEPELKNFRKEIEGIFRAMGG